MRCYIISYELKQPRAAYIDFCSELRSYHANAQILEHVWAVVTDGSAADIRDRLWELLDPDDGILVLESSREAAWQDVRCENQWLRDNLTNG